MAEPAFHSDPVQLPHLKLSLDVSSFVRLDNGAIGRILQSKEETVNNVKKQLVLILYYTLVIRPDKFDFELTAENNRRSFWFASSMIDSIVFVLFAGESKVDIFAWIGRTNTFISNDNSSFNFLCALPPFTLQQVPASQSG